MLEQALGAARERLFDFLSVHLPAGSWLAALPCLGTVILGLVLVFFGYRLRRWVLFLAGLGIGIVAVLVWAAHQRPEAPRGAFLWPCLGGGLVTGVLFLALLWIGLFFAGAGLCAALAAILCSLVGFEVHPNAYLVPALLGGVAALFFERWVIVGGTALLGAVAALWGAWELSGPRDPARWFGEAPADLPTGTWGAVVVAGFLALAAAGLSVQLRALKRADAVAVAKRIT